MKASCLLETLTGPMRVREIISQLNLFSLIEHFNPSSDNNIFFKYLKFVSKLLNINTDPFCSETSITRINYNNNVKKCSADVIGWERTKCTVYKVYKGHFHWSLGAFSARGSQALHSRIFLARTNSFSACNPDYT